MNQNTFVTDLMAKAVNQKQKVSTCQDLDLRDSACCVKINRDLFSSIFHLLAICCLSPSGPL